jgi:hypothetical protein
MRPTNGRASGDGHDPNKISKQKDACLFTINHLVIFIVLLGKDVLHRDGANPCDKLHLQLRLLIPLNDIERIATKAGQY